MMEHSKLKADLEKCLAKSACKIQTTRQTRIDGGHDDIVDLEMKITLMRHSTLENHPKTKVLLRQAILEVMDRYLPLDGSPISTKPVE